MPVRPLSKELQEVAINELNEDPARIQKDLEYIREWIAKQPHLNTRTDDQFLVAFLRGSKYSLERTKEKLDTYNTIKTITPEIFNNRDPFSPEIQKILSLGLMVPLPKLPTPDSPRYIFMRNGKAEEHKIEHEDMFKVSTIMQEIMLLEDNNMSVSGIVGIQDMSKTSLGYFMSMPPSLMKKSTTIMQKGYPVRIKAIHFFNISSFFETIHNIIKPFLTEKIKSRMRVHSSLDDILQVIPKEVLPEEFGGESGKMDDIIQEWKTKVESYRDWFLEDVKYRNDESKRLGAPKTSESVFGMEGSFRQLSVD